MAYSDTYSAWFHVEDPDNATDEEREECGSQLHAMVGRLENDQQGRIAMLVKYASIYQNMDVLKGSGLPGMSMPQMILNVSQAIVDSLVAKQVVNASKATFDVDEGDWEAHLKAEDMDRFVFGERYRVNFDMKNEQCFRDSAWAGDGWGKATEVNRKIFYERVSPFEMLLDVESCRSGEPRELYQRRYVSKSVAQGLYPRHAATIGNMQPQSPPVAFPGASGDGHLVRVVEGWHLPDDEHPGDQEEVDEETGDKVCTGRKGVYIFAVNDLVLELREWKRPRFPFVRMPYSQDVTGGYSIGVIQQLAPLQIELNKLKHRKLQGLRLYGIPRQYRQAGSTCTPDFNTDIGQEYVITGTMPQVLETPTGSMELSPEEQNLINQMYQLAGISPLERGNDMPSRMDSRPGMREYIAAADEKHALPSQTWNRSFLDSARIFIDVARDIVTRHGSYASFGAAKDFVSKIDFADIDLEDERFRIKLQNTNLLPTTPTGKRLAILDLLKANAFNNPMEMWEMLAGDHPDVDSILNRKTAGRKLVEKQMYVITVKRKYFAPDTHQDVQFAKSVALDNCQKILLKSNGGYEEDGTPNEEAQKIVSMLDKYIAACDSITLRAKQKAEQDAATVSGAGGPVPGPVPAPSPGALPPGPVPAGPAPGPVPQLG